MECYPVIPSQPVILCRFYLDYWEYFVKQGASYSYVSVTISYPLIQLL